MQAMNDPVAHREWLTADTVYEGFPIYFRRPDIAIAEYSRLCADYPVRLTVTHFLVEVKDNGLPQTDYNSSLADFDAALIAMPRESGAGIVTLVETFAGKRTYYVFIRQGVDAEAGIRKLLQRFPREKLEWSLKPDPQWRLMKGYAKDFGFT